MLELETMLADVRIHCETQHLDVERLRHTTNEHSDVCEHQAKQTLVCYKRTTKQSFVWSDHQTREHRSRPRALLTTRTHAHPTHAYALHAYAQRCINIHCEHKKGRFSTRTLLSPSQASLSVGQPPFNGTPHHSPPPLPRYIC